MTNRVVAGILTTICLLCAFATADESVSDNEIVFARDIQPLLAKHCLLCHGPDDAEAGLRLDRADDAYTELDSGEHAIVPGEADASELLRRVETTDESIRMPPDGDPLSAHEIKQLTLWVDEGAEYEVHWAYQSVSHPPRPQVTQQEWVRNPIDRFVLARLEREGIAPSPEADRATLVKRLYYDLVGMPPDPQDVKTFESDDGAEAYENLVDRLLASQHFGERWGRHWMDKARYADSDGYEKDKPRPAAWRYRDWVIEAVNRDTPYDTFTTEQLAGDLLPDASPAQKLATAFHRQTLTNTEGGIDKEEFRVEATFDRTETTASVWMALTMTCARCHSHKYDQISQREYYQLFAFFNNANEANIEVARDAEALAQYRKDKKTHDAKVAAMTKKYASARQQMQPQVDQWLQEFANRLASAGERPLKFSPVELLEARTSGNAELKVQDDQSLLATGSVPDKDKYTLVIKAPEDPLTGIRLELLPHATLGKQGPGRTPHGNFVLSEIRAYVSDDRDFKQHSRIDLVAAQADFAQDRFAADGALSDKSRSGWAVAPQMGKAHQITFYTKEPLALSDKEFVQIVLDQQYGEQHTIGRFRITTLTGFDPLKALPKPIADAVIVEATKRSEKQREVIAEHVASQDPTTAGLAQRLVTLKERAPQPPMITVPVMASAARTTKVLHRGDFLQPADEVTAGALAVINYTHPLKSRLPDSPADRLDLATWLVDKNHPLTSRVAVNHTWGHLFGRGIVSTLNDFGVRGDLPTHPKLLDWLAWHFPRDMGWSRKTLIKTIVLSATYRQSSHHRPELYTVDPTNQLLARQNRVRVEAEVVRDLHLAVSGLLSRKTGGPSVFPPLPPGVAELSYANNFKWKTSSGEDRYRRGMYTFFKRTSPYPTLISFDCPDSNTTRVKRETSNTPLQALVTLNNDVFAEAAQAMVTRVLAEGGQDDLLRLTYAMQLCVVRQPTSEEIEPFRNLLDVAREYYQSHTEEAKQLTSRHTAKDIRPEENAAWVATMRMIMNLDEFLVRD